MKRLVLAGLGMLWATSSFSGTLADKLLADYDAVQSVSCEIRRDAETPQGSGRVLSRVYYQKPDRLNVENISPIKRRIVADGSTFYSYIEGDPKGFSRPVANLSQEMLESLRKVPGTAMDHLLRLQGVPETPLEGTADYPVRAGYQTTNLFVILNCDASQRLARVEFYRDPEHKILSAQYTYSAFQEVLPGVWIPCHHDAFMNVQDVETTEKVRVSNLQVNQEIAPALFDAEPFFKGVNFVDDFSKIYE